MYNSTDLLLVLVAIILIPLLIFGIPWIITSVLLWGINGVWGIDLADKFCYCYWMIFVLRFLFRSGGNINWKK